MIVDFTLSYLLHYCTDCSILVVASSAFATSIRLEQWSGYLRFETEPHALFIAGA